VVNVESGDDNDDSGEPTHHLSSFDEAKFRQVLGHFPTGVAVVTAVNDGAPAGLAVGSFA